MVIPELLHLLDQSGAMRSQLVFSAPASPLSLAICSASSSRGCTKLFHQPQHQSNATRSSLRRSHPTQQTPNPLSLHDDNIKEQIKSYPQDLNHSTISTQVLPSDTCHHFATINSLHVRKRKDSLLASRF